jgi:autotransporter-associated beta strand protein
MKPKRKKNQITIHSNYQSLAPGLAILAAAVSLPDARAADGTWTQTTSGNLWSTTTNWSGSTVADGSGFTANFNTLNPTTDNTVRLDSDRTLTNLIFGDTDISSAAGWLLDNNGTPTNNLILAGTTPTVTVNPMGTGKTATISAIIEGAVGLTKAGNGTLTLSGINTYTGTTSINAGILAITNNNALGTTSSGNGTTVSNNAALRLDGNGLNVAEPLTIRGDGSNFSGALNNAVGTNTYSGLITVDPAGSARIRAAASTTLNLTGGVTNAGTGALALTANGAIQITTTPLTLGSGNTLNVYEIGTVTLGVAGSTFGTVTPAWQGTLKAGAANVLPSASILSLGGTGGVNAGTGTFDLAGFGQTIGGLRTTALVSEGTRTVTNSSGTATTLTVNQSSNTTYDGRFTSALALNKQGVGTLTLNGPASNTHTGLTTVTGGTLELNKTAGVNAIAGDGTAGTNDVQVNTGATLKHLAANQISDNVTVNLNAGTWNLNGQNETIRNLNAAVVSGTGPTLTPGTGSLLTLNRIDWDNSGAQLTSNLGGASVGASAGTLRFVADATTQSIFDANYAGTLNVNSAVQIDATSLTFRSSTWGTNLKGQVSGAGKIIFDPSAGSGELILENGANNYAGGTQWISDTGASGAWERLTVSASGALGSGNVTIQGGNQNTWVPVFSGTPTAFVFTGNTNHSNTFTLSGNATISVSNPDGATASSETVILSGNVNLDNNTLFVRGRGTGTISGEISGTSGITKIDNPGTWIFTGTNTYNGATTVSAGTLRAGAAAGGQAFGNGSAVTLANVTGASLDLNGFSQSIGSLSGGGLTGGNVTLGANANLTTGGNNSSSSYEGVISGTGTSGLIKSGSGTQTLTGTNTYTGTTVVNGGKLTIASTGTINGTSGVSIGAGEFNYDSSTALTQGVSFSGTGGKLSGNGIINLAVNVTTGNTLAPGNSPGTMAFADTLGLNGTTLMEIDGSVGAGVAGGHDFVNLTGIGANGVLNYGGTMTLDIGTIFGMGNYSFNLFSFASKTGTFATITLADQYSGSLLDSDLNGVWNLTSGDNNWQFTESTGVLGLTIVPEPHAALLGGVGLLMLLGRRRND